MALIVGVIAAVVSLVVAAVVHRRVTKKGKRMKMRRGGSGPGMGSNTKGKGLELSVNPPFGRLGEVDTGVDDDTEGAPDTPGGVVSMATATLSLSPGPRLPSMLNPHDDAQAPNTNSSNSNSNSAGTGAGFGAMASAVVHTEMNASDNDYDEDVEVGLCDVPGDSPPAPASQFLEGQVEVTGLV